MEVTKSDINRYFEGIQKWNNYQLRLNKRKSNMEKLYEKTIPIFNEECKVIVSRVAIENPAYGDNPAFISDGYLVEGFFQEKELGYVLYESVEELKISIESCINVFTENARLSASNKSTKQDLEFLKCYGFKPC
jgi:hypothetical protein